MRKGSLPVISLFSGAMGLDLGLEQAGIQPTFSIEVDDLCCATMRRNRPDHDVWQADISTLGSKAITGKPNTGSCSPIAIRVWPRQSSRQKLAAWRDTAAPSESANSGTSAGKARVPAR